MAIVLYCEADRSVPLLGWLDRLPDKTRLACFHGQQAVVLSHGLIKQQAEVPAAEIKRARERKVAFALNPARHTHKE